MTSTPAKKKKPSGKKYKWGIRKKSRNTNRSYTGPTWKRIGVLDPPEVFGTKREAERWLDQLNEANRVGFEAFPMKKETPDADR